MRPTRSIRRLEWVVRVKELNEQILHLMISTTRLATHDDFSMLLKHSYRSFRSIEYSKRGGRSGVWHKSAARFEDAFQLSRRWAPAFMVLILCGVVLVHVWRGVLFLSFGS